MDIDYDKNYLYDDGMGWDILWVLVSPPLKRLFKGPPPSFPGFTLWVGRVIPKNNLHHDHVCTDEFTQTGATRLLDSDLERKMPKSTERGSHSNPLKEEATPVHKRRKLLESTEGSSCTSPGGGNHLILLV